MQHRGCGLHLGWPDEDATGWNLVEEAPTTQGNYDIRKKGPMNWEQTLSEDVGTRGRRSVWLIVHCR